MDTLVPLALFTLNFFFIIIVIILFYKFFLGVRLLILSLCCLSAPFLFLISCFQQLISIFLDREL